VLWVGQGMLMSGSNRRSSESTIVFRFLDVCVYAWIESSRATGIPYHARVLRRSSVLWGNHSTPFPSEI